MQRRPVLTSRARTKLFSSEKIFNKIFIFKLIIFLMKIFSICQTKFDVLITSVCQILNCHTGYLALKLHLKKYIHVITFCVNFPELKLEYYSHKVHSNLKAIHLIIISFLFKRMIQNHFLSFSFLPLRFSKRHNCGTFE